MKQGAHLTKPGWSKPHIHYNPTNFALFRRKIALYRFNQGGGSYYCRGLKWEQGAEPPGPPHFNDWVLLVRLTLSVQSCSTHMISCVCLFMYRELLSQYVKNKQQDIGFYRATLCVSAVFAVARCLSVRLSRSCIVSRWPKTSSNFFLGPVAPSF